MRIILIRDLVNLNVLKKICPFLPLYFLKICKAVKEIINDI